ncbi:hypothetical protein F5146DRAFT_1176843 [Armillaria mellea]|nr:hypothetical protein F5146DRAFT_1176843 [Armillaria mellea]
MYATTRQPKAQYRPPTQSPRTNQFLPTTQPMQTIESIQSVTIKETSTTQPISTAQPIPTTPKSEKYIVITGLGKSCVALKSNVSTYAKLINYIRTYFPGTYHKSLFSTIPLPIAIQTCDLPISKGRRVDVQPDVWATIVADIDNIEIGIARFRA